MAIPAVATKLPVASELSWDIVLPIFGWRSFALPVNADEIPTLIFLDIRLIESGSNFGI